jgi:hypothetical protein
MITVLKVATVVMALETFAALADLTSHKAGFVESFFRAAADTDTRRFGLCTSAFTFTFNLFCLGLGLFGAKRTANIGRARWIGLFAALRIADKLTAAATPTLVSSTTSAHIAGGYLADAREAKNEGVGLRWRGRRTGATNNAAIGVDKPATSCSVASFTRAAGPRGTDPRVASDIVSRWSATLVSDNLRRSRCRGDWLCRRHGNGWRRSRDSRLLLRVLRLVANLADGSANTTLRMGLLETRRCLGIFDTARFAGG